jgi:hypothetical protein
MSTTNSLSQNNEVKEMYRLWLSGKSIRKIARAYDVGRMAVWAALRREYGKDACSPQKQSLARVCYKEYGDLETALRAKGIEGLYMSERTENNYSKHQTKENSFDSQSYSEDAFEPALLWAYFRLLIDTIADGVAEVYAGALIEMAMSEAD